MTQYTTRIEIIKVANGYLVRRGPDYTLMDGADHASDMRVYETFDALTTWLREYFEAQPVK